jgi:hypothetical protein
VGLRKWWNGLAHRGRGPALHLGFAARPEETADRLIAEGNQAEKDGRLHDACELYREAVQVAPGNAKAHLNSSSHHVQVAFQSR